MKIDQRGKNLDEIGYFNEKAIIRVDPKYFRPTEVNSLLGNSNKAKVKLNWVPKISFEQLVKEMVDNDLKLAKNQKLIP